MPVANAPPISPPMLVPAAMSIGMWCSSNQRMTPTCAMPRALPPPNATPTVGRLSCAGLPCAEMEAGNRVVDRPSARSSLDLIEGCRSTWSCRARASVCGAPSRSLRRCLRQKPAALSTRAWQLRTLLRLRPGHTTFSDDAPPGTPATSWQGRGQARQVAAQANGEELARKHGGWTGGADSQRQHRQPAVRRERQAVTAGGDEPSSLP